MTNPADVYPMMLIGGTKVMANIDILLKYLCATFPEIKMRFFDYQNPDKFEKLMYWYVNTLKPACDSIIRCFVKNKPDT